MVVIRIGEERVHLRTGEHEIGRAPDCRIIVDNFDVSRRHARLIVTDQAEVSILDLGSRNGTLVDGQPLESWVARPLALGTTITLGHHVLTVEAPGPVPAIGTGQTEGRELAATALRSCPVCREASAREAPRCKRCGLDFSDPEAVELHEFTGSRPTLRKLPTPAEPDGVLVISQNAGFLRLLRPAFTVSDDLVLGAGSTVEQASADLGLARSLGSTAPTATVAVVLLDAPSIAAGVDPRLVRQQLGVPVVLYGTAEDVDGFADAARLGTDTFVRQSASTILFVARVRLSLARLKRSSSPSRLNTRGPSFTLRHS